jgi:hypothetical protein
MKKESWKITFYRANVDSATTSYTEVPVSTLASYASYAATTAYILAPQKTKDVVGELLTDVSGWQDGIVSVRDVFDVELYPYKYDASATDPDLDDWEALLDWLNAKPKLWVSIQGGSRTYPATATNAHPIVIESVSESVNRSAGVHNVYLQLRVKGTR